jgi:hypothetical protein
MTLGAINVRGHIEKGLFCLFVGHSPSGGNVGHVSQLIHETGTFAGN